MDLLLDAETHDIVFDNSGATATTEQKQSVAQLLKIKLLTFLGEWFLNTDNGVPYYQQIFGKVRSKAAVDAIFREKILEEPEVLELVEFESSINAERTYSLTFRVRTTLGQITDSINIDVGA